MLVDYMPTFLMTSMAFLLNKELEERGYKIKQHYLIHSLYCLIALLITIPDIILLYSNFSNGFNLSENTGWWATRWLMCYELFYVISSADGGLDQNEFKEHFAKYMNLWLAYYWTNEGALYSLYLAVVLCIPDLFSSLTMFMWAELDIIHIYTFKAIIQFINSYYKPFVLSIYIVISIVCNIWISTHKEYTIINILFLIKHATDVYKNKWYFPNEPYARCLRLLENYV